MKSNMSNKNRVQSACDFYWVDAVFQEDEVRRGDRKL